MIARRMLSNSIKAVLATAFFVPPALAQTAEATATAPSVQTVSEVCAAVPPFDDAAMRPLAERAIAQAARKRK